MLLLTLRPPSAHSREEPARRGGERAGEALQWSRQTTRAAPTANDGLGPVFLVTGFRGPGPAETSPVSRSPGSTAKPQPVVPVAATIPSVRQMAQAAALLPGCGAGTPGLRSESPGLAPVHQPSAPALPDRPLSERVVHKRSGAGCSANSERHGLSPRARTSMNARAIEPSPSSFGLKMVTLIPTARPLLMPARRTAASSSHDSPSGMR
jgi:hypothetical protein